MGDKKHLILDSKPHQLALAAALIFFFAGLAVLPSLDPDVWWHLKLGELIEQTRTIPRTDPFAYPSAAQPFLAHGWLSEVLFYNFYRMAGWAGLFWFKAVVIAATLAVIYKLMVRRINYFLPAALLLILTAPVSMLGWELRPQILGYLCFALLLLWLDRYRRGEGVPFPLPALFLLWANLHASVVLGLLLILIYAAGDLLERRKSPEIILTTGADTKTLFKNFLLCAAAALINPQHYKTLLHPLMHITREAFPRMLTEWQAPTLAGAPLFFVLAGVCLGVLLWRLFSRHRQVWWGECFLVISLGVLALTALRQIPFFALAAGPFLALGWSQRRKNEEPLSWERPRLLYALSIVLLAGSLLLPRWGRSWQAFPEEQRWPQEAAYFVQKINLTGNMYNFFDWGGYLTYKLWPKQKVFILGISTDQQVFQDSFTILAGGEKARETLDRHRIDYIITPALFDSGKMLPYIITLYQDPQWGLIYQDKQSAVLLRNVFPYEEYVQQRFPLAKERLFIMAREQAEERLKHDPKNHRARLSLALACSILGDRAAALKEVETVISQKPAGEVLKEALFMQSKIKNREK